MSASYKTLDKSLVIAIDGEIDHHATKTLRVEIDDMILKSMPEKIIFDFSRTTFMDSSGLGLILGRYRKAQAAGVTLEVVNPGVKIFKILQMASLDKLIEIKGVEK